MSRIRSSGSRPERVLRALIRDLTGARIRCNLRSLPGSPDVVVPSIRLAVMMDGCYWHGCPAHFRVPGTNRAFWEEKIRRNRSRDRRDTRELVRLGWTVWRIWEHDLRRSRLSRTRRNLRRRIRRLASR